MNEEKKAIINHVRLKGLEIGNMATRSDGHPSSDLDLTHKTSSADPRSLAPGTNFHLGLSTRSSLSCQISNNIQPTPSRSQLASKVVDQSPKDFQD